MLSLAFALLASSPAQGLPTDSPILIRLIGVGSAPAPAAEVVMLQMTDDGQQVVEGETLSLYGPGGALTASYEIPGDVSHGLRQRTILLAAPGAVAIPPDFDLDTGDALDPSGGALCRTGAYPADCATWGSFPVAAAAALPDPQSHNAEAIVGGALGRSIERGCPTYLDPSDDTGTGSVDFFDGAPPPGPGNPEPSPPSPSANADEALTSPCPLVTGFNLRPPNPTNNTTATFAYGVVPTEYGVIYHCRFASKPLGSTPFGTCPSPSVDFPGLADGTYEFEVFAEGAAGADPTSLSWEWTVDTVPPDTTILSTPSQPSNGFSASFGFASTEPHPGFVCQLESGPVQPCEPGKTYFNLADGPHLFRVWASDQATNQDPTPAVAVFDVDTTFGDVAPPDTTIVSTPSKQSSRTSATFSYRSSEPRSTFQCRIDSRDFTPCEPSGITYSALRNGSHTFRVKATDRAGNTDLIPDYYTWAVKAPLPKTQLTAVPPGASFLRRGAKALALSFAFRADKPNSTFRCRLDQRPFKPCRSPRKVKARAGRHRFEVYAIDSLGNEEATPERRIFRVLGRGGGLFG